LESDTIVAVSTAASAGAIGIVRLSGASAVDITARVFVPSNGMPVRSIPTHSITHGYVVDPANGERVDETLLVMMQGPRSYTREDIVELHCHGGVVAVRSVLELVVGQGARIAEPGEFTRRAFVNGRIDLAQAESVAQIVAARSGGALRASVRQLSGGLSERLRCIRAELVSLLASIEANVDFSDEEVEEVDWSSSRLILQRERARLGELLRTCLLGRAFQYGVRTAIVGRPNAGKSSLLNALVMRERAIVSDTPGTTRDTVEGELEIGGVPIRLIDTAGLRSEGEGIERLGIERSLLALEEADLVMVVADLGVGVERAEEELVAKAGIRPCIVVGNKVDLVGSGSAAFDDLCRLASERDEDADGAESPVRRVCEVSARTGDGIEGLREVIGQVVGGGVIDMQEPVLVGERQRLLVKEAAERLDDAVAGVEDLRGEELVAEDVRAAAEAIGRVIGEDVSADLLDEIFGRFCLGK
jgi:tRNA modification GTPase